MSKILPHISLNFDYFLAQNWIRKLCFMLKAPKFVLMLLTGGAFWPQLTIFQVPLHPTPSPMRVPPNQAPRLRRGPKHSQKQVPPTKNFVKQLINLN